MVNYLPEPTGGDFRPAPMGAHRAVCYRLIDLGTQKKEYQGQTSYPRQVMISWELSDEFMEDGKPFVLSKFYTWSMSEKANLRKDLEAWRGRPFEQVDFGPNGRFKPINLIGAPCLLNVVHDTKANGDVKAKIASIMPMTKGMQKPSPVNETLFFSLDDYKPALMEALSDGVKQIIMRSPEYSEAVKRLMGSGNNEPPPHDDSDIPF